MKCRKVWSNKAYFEYERNWEKLTWNIKQSYSLLFPIWIAGSISQKEADARGEGPRNSIFRQILQHFKLYRNWSEQYDAKLIYLVYIWSGWTFKSIVLNTFFLLKNYLSQSNIIITPRSSIIYFLVKKLWYTKDKLLAGQFPNNHQALVNLFVPKVSEGQVGPVRALLGRIPAWKLAGNELSVLSYRLLWQLRGGLVGNTGRWVGGDLRKALLDHISGRARADRLSPLGAA